MKTTMTLMLLSITLLLNGCAREDPLVVTAKREGGKEHALAADSRKEDAVPAQETAERSDLSETEEPEALPDEIVPQEPAQPADTATVYVCGAVASPGVVTVGHGARVLEAVLLAGGLTDEADDTWINLAQQVGDGWMIRIRTREETDRLREQGITPLTDRFGIMESIPDMSDTVMNGPASVQAGLVNINTADVSLLATLPGIGEAKAESIIAYRQRNGLFTDSEQIVNVSGIGPSVYEKIRLLICV